MSVTADERGLAGERLEEARGQSVERNGLVVVSQALKSGGVSAAWESVDRLMQS